MNTQFNLLLVDDDPDFCQEVGKLLSTTDDLTNQALPNIQIDVEYADSQDDARMKLDKNPYDVAVVDLRLKEHTTHAPDSDIEGGLKVLKYIKEEYPSTKVIIVTAEESATSIKTAFNAITQDGAFHYLFKYRGTSFHKQLLLELKRAWQYMEIETFAREKIKEEGGIIGDHPKLREVLDVVPKVAPTNASVLILGETGTGKELVARAIHNNSPRKNKPFVPVNLSALPPGLIESELFGHEKGAFSNAIRRRIGRFEKANGGTIFLDEIGELSRDIQVKLLRVLDQRKFERVGGEQTISVDVRVIAATNAYLQQMMKEKKFREDLYFRINVVKIEMPPLRERKSDIPLLTQHFINQSYSELNQHVNGISDDSLEYLKHYNWPGNVRELKNAIERAVIFCKDEFITPEHLPDEIKTGKAISPKSQVEREKLLEEIQQQLKGSYQPKFERLWNDFATYCKDNKVTGANFLNHEHLQLAVMLAYENSKNINTERLKKSFYISQAGLDPSNGNISTAVSHMFSFLVEKGFLKREGGGHATFYSLGDAFQSNEPS